MSNYDDMNTGKLSSARRSIHLPSGALSDTLIGRQQNSGYGDDSLGVRISMPIGQRQLA